MDFMVCCIVFVFQCLNLVKRSDCEQIDGRLRDSSPLSLRFERTMENIRLSWWERHDSPASTETATFPFRCSLTSDTLQFPSLLSSTPLPLSQFIQFIVMPVQDRTNEFMACVESIRNRSTISSRNVEQKQRLLHAQAKESPKSEFTRLASVIAKDINTTTIRLGKLAQRECTFSSPLPSC